MQGKPLVGLICDHHSAVLEGLINRAGYRAVRVQPDRLDPSALPSVIAWVIDCADTDPVADKTALLEPRVVALSNRPSPRDHAAYRSWCERIILTLDRIDQKPRQLAVLQMQCHLSFNTVFSRASMVNILATYMIENFHLKTLIYALTIVANF